MGRQPMKKKEAKGQEAKKTWRPWKLKRKRRRKKKRKRAPWRR